MRASLQQAKPSRRPRPRQLNAEDWVASYVQPNVSSQGSRRESDFSSYISEGDSSVEYHSTRSSLPSARKSSMEESLCSWEPRSSLEPAANTKYAASSRHGDSETSPESQNTFRSRCYSDRSDLESLDSEEKVRPLCSLAPLPLELRERHFEERHRPSDRADNQSEFSDDSARSYSAATKPVSTLPRSVSNSSREGYLPHAYHSHGDSDISSEREWQSVLQRQREESQGRHDGKATSERYAHKDFRIDLDRPKHGDLEQSLPDMHNQKIDTERSSFLTPGHASSNQSDNDSPNSASSIDSQRQSRSAPTHSISAGFLSTTRSTASVTRTPSEQRAELYAFRKDMREVFCSVDEMVDAHRDVFRSDPTTGIPSLNTNDLLHAESLAEQVFKQLKNLRERYQLVAASFTKEPPTSPPSDITMTRVQLIKHGGANSPTRSSEASNHTIDDGSAPQHTIGTRAMSGADSLDTTLPTFVGCSSLGSPDDDASSVLPVSRRSSASHSSISASMDAPDSPTITAAAESTSTTTIPSKVSPSRGSSTTSESMTSFLINVKPNGKEESGASLFQDFDRRMEEIRSSLSAIAKGRPSVPRARSPSSATASSGDRQRQLRKLLAELQASE